MRYIIIDTSSILFGFKYNKNVFDIAGREFHLYKQSISEGIINELRRISRNKGNRGVYARLALLELRAKNISVDKIITNADSWILDKALRNRESIVITNDTALAGKLRNSNISVLKISKSGNLKFVR